MALNINGTTGISGVDGSVSAPAVTGTDSNTGITFPSADTIKFSTGGVERMAITNSGVTGVSGGKILQVVNVDVANTEITANSTSFVSMNTSVSITPSATSSKVFILMTGGGTYLPTTQSFAYVTVYRGSTNIGDSSTGLEGFYNTGTSYAIVPHSLSVLDSPNTTSATTYTLYARCTNGTYQFQQADRPHITLTAMEVAG